MRGLKRLAFLLIALLSIGVCGCMSGEDTNQPERMKDMALAYLNEHYDDVFMPLSYFDGDWAYEYESITFTSEKFPDAIVEVRGYKNDNGSYRFKDNYYHCYMLDGAVSYGKELLAGENTVVKVRFANTVWSDELAGAQSFAEWQEQGTARVDFFMITGNALSADVQTGIVSKIADDKVCGYVTFIETEEDNLLQEIPLDEILNNHNKFVVSENDYFINREFEIEIN